MKVSDKHHGQPVPVATGYKVYGPQSDSGCDAE
jgi:hypothetical protein